MSVATATRPAPTAGPGRKTSAPQRAWRKLQRFVQNSVEVGKFLPDSTKDINLYLQYPGSSPAGRWLTRWFWKFSTHRLTRAGHWFFYLTMALAFFAAISLEIQTYIPFLYAMCFWVVAGWCVLFSTPKVSLKARHASVVTAGEPLLVDAEVTSTRRGGLFPAQDMNLVPSGLPVEIDAESPAGTPIGNLAPGESARLRMTLLPKKRGVFTLPGYRVESDFPFGLMNAYQRIPLPSPVTVYPAFTPLNDFALPTGSRFQEGGVALLAKQGDSFEFWGNREWREGDSQRDIDWRATARLGGEKPIVREWREEYFFRVGIVLDTLLPRPTGRWRGLIYGPRAYDVPKNWQSAFERAISLSAAIGDYMAREQYVVDIFAAGPTLHHLTVGRGTGYRDEILNILAGVEETSEEPVSQIEPELLANISRLTTVICVFLQYDDRRREFVELLRSTGVGVKVIITPPRAKEDEDEPDEENGSLTGTVTTLEQDTVLVDARAFALGLTAL